MLHSRRTYESFAADQGGSKKEHEIKQTLSNRSEFKGSEHRGPSNDL